MITEHINQHLQHKIGASLTANGVNTICLDCMVIVEKVATNV